MIFNRLSREERENRRRERLDQRLHRAEHSAEFKDKRASLMMPTFTKVMVALIIFICLIDLQLTYILAFLGKDNIVESLSETLSNTILGVAFTYMLKAYFENRNKHKDDNKPTGFRNKASEVLSRAANALSESDDLPVDDISDDDLPIEDQIELPEPSIELPDLDESVIEEESDLSVEPDLEPEIEPELEPELDPEPELEIEPEDDLNFNDITEE